MEKGRGTQHDLGELFNAQRGLESSKISERKKSASTLRDLLESDYIIDFIDNEPRAKSRSSSITWTQLFRSIVIYIFKEADVIVKLEQAGNASTYTSRQTKKKDVGDMFIAYVRAANKRGPHLPISDVLDHVTTVLENRKMVSWLCMDYSHILANYLLNVPFYILQISLQMWDKLLSIYCDLFLSPHPSFDRTTLSKNVLTLITLSTSQCDLQPVTLYSFFTRALTDINQENPTVLDNLLASLNAFSVAMATNARGRLCKIGEDVFPCLLNFWGRCQPVAKDQVVKFLRFQMKIHHPQGTHTDDEGAWASNDALWKKYLESLYTQIISDIGNDVVQRTKANRSPSGKDESRWKPELIDLACDLAYQVVFIQSERCTLPSDITQPRAGKRHKAQTIWTTIRDGLPDNSPSVVVWLKLAAWLLAKFPDSLPREENLFLLSQLHKMQTEAKKLEYTQWVFACLHVLALNPTTPTSLSPVSKDLWWKVWTNTLKAVSVHVAEEQGCALLTTLVEQHLVDVGCDQEPWQLLNKNQPTTKPLVCLLVALLKNHVLPEAIYLPLVTPTHPYPLRAQLLNFLIPTCVPGRVEGGTNIGFVTGLENRPPVSLVAHALVALTQRSCSSAQLAFPQNINSPVQYIAELLGLSLDQRQWTCVERVYLESTFDMPLVLPTFWRDKGTPVTLSRENPIRSVQTLLLELLAKRAESLLLPIEIEESSSAYDRAYQLSHLLESQAYHCCLVLHVLLLLCHCEAFTHVDQLRKTPVIGKLPDLLKRISAAVTDTLWNDVEKKSYFLTAKTLLETLQPLVRFSHLEDCQLSSTVRKALQVIRKVCRLSFPPDLLETIAQLAQGKWPVSTMGPLGPTASSSTFSVCESSASNSRAHSFVSERSPSPFEDDNDGRKVRVADNNPSTQSDAISTMKLKQGGIVTDVVSPSRLKEKSSCRLEAAQWLCYWYKNMGATPGGIDDGDPMGESGESFDTHNALLNTLSEETLDVSKPAGVQLVLRMGHILSSYQEQLDAEVVEGLLQVLGQMLSVHRKNQCVYRESLRVLAMLAPHFREATDDSHARSQCKNIFSAFWSLYLDGTLHVPVRVELASCLRSFLLVDPNSSWTTITIRKKKKKTEPTEESLSLREALVRMVCDTDHRVRMHMVKEATALYFGGEDGLPSRQLQEETFQQITKMLHKAHQVPTDQDDLSAEDDSVNRVSSMITTMLYEACVSPVCEKKVVSVLATAVGHGHIDTDLVYKAFGQLSSYLDYSSTRQFLEDKLVFLVSSWLNEGFVITEFPFRLFGFDSSEAFFSCYANQIVPYLVYLCDEPFTKAIAHLIHTPLPDLLRTCLPSSMVLILTNYAQQDRGDNEESSQERRSRANASHDLLIKYLTQEVVASTIQSSIDEFVVELLSRMYEPHTANTHLAKYSRSSDPEPCPPHFTSMVVRATLDYMPTCYGSTAAETSFIRLLSRRKDHIQKILLSLNVRINSAHRAFKKRTLFLAYSLFVSLVCKELKEGLDGTQAFVLRDIIYSVLRILTRLGEKEREQVMKELFAPCCDTLLTVCKTAVEACPQELAKHLQTIIPTLFPFAAQQHTAEGKQALSVISYLVLKSESDTLAEHVALLDPFPKVEPFTKLCQKQSELREAIGGVSLSHEIERFLSVSQKCPQSSRKEGLKFLQGLLPSSKFEIAHLKEQVSSGGSPIVNLILGLVSLCQLSTETGTSTEVARCLGEIGPTDLRCIALPTSKEFKSSFDKNSLPSHWDHSARCTTKILHLLTFMLFDKDISVVRASGECLRAILGTKRGSLVLGKIEELNLEDDWHVYLEPFKPQKKKKMAPSQPPSLPALSTFPSHMDIPDLWLPNVGVSHQAWITRLVTTLITSGGVTDEVLLLLTPVCLVKVELCEEVFPLLIHNILIADNEDLRSILSQQIRLFFADVSMPRPSSPAFGQHGRVHPDSIRTMLNVVLYLRTVDRPKKSRSTSTPWENNFWLELDFLDISKAAQLCEAYFTSLLYTEIWRDATSSTSQNGVAMETTSQIGSRLNDPIVENLLVEAYSRIGEPDSLYVACSLQRIQDDTSQTRMFEHEGQWHRALSAYSLRMLLPEASCERNVAESLHHLGLTHVLHIYLRGVSIMNPEAMAGVSEYQYEAAWRCSLWESTEKHSVQMIGSKGGYHQNVYNCLMALKDGEVNHLQSTLAEARSEVFSGLCSTKLESVYAIYPSMSKLLTLLELEEAGSELGSSSSDLTFLKGWKERLQFMDSDFQFIEPVLSLRSSVLHALMNLTAAEVQRDPNPSIAMRRRVEGLFSSLTETLFTQARLAREAGSYDVAEVAIFGLKCLHERRASYGVPEALHPSLYWSLYLEKAKVHWERGESSPALRLLNALMQELSGLQEKTPEVALLYPIALCLYGNWVAELHSETPVIIMKTYLEKSVQLMEEMHSRDQPALVKVYFSLARYADNLYDTIKLHKMSFGYKDKRQMLLISKRVLQKLANHMSDEEYRRNRYVRTIQAQSDIDETALYSMLENQQQYLETALKNYLLCLKTGDEHDIRMFRLCALWFSNPSNSEVNKIMKEAATVLESRKFLPMMYQLAARMSAQTLPKDPFQQILHEIIYRTTRDHPHHTVYIILALSNASLDNRFPTTGHVTGTKKTTGRLQRKTSGGVGMVDEDKVKAATDLITKLRTHRPTLISAMEQLCEAYIDLAYHDVQAFRKQRGPFRLPASCPLLKLPKSRLEVVAMPTKELEVDRTCQYRDIVHIDRFDSLFQLAGGINLPKVLSCIGSDGARKRQLVKGKDDLRQDAVMQQVFILVNRLLKKEQATSRRNLSIRTYKVIPLSQRSGIVEWCEGTRPLGEYLIGSPQNPSQGAHHRYNPSDWSSMDCRRKLTAAGKEKTGSKYQVYQEICDHFKPVFRHFFLEYFPSPSEWFERRLAYTRSVAASSIVGYLVGLGDRHVQNILIDTNTAEFIHIDLGVAFEQGMTLPTPETVPFRLTRDVVDGMGSTGVKGIFQRCCEETMNVMKTSHEELRTIIEVLLHDPLYQWTISPMKAFNLQFRHDTQEPSTSSTTTSPGEQIFMEGQASSKAEEDTDQVGRLLLRLGEKLDAIEDGSAISMSVSGQVSRLIQEATDPSNLCCLFPGWQPWI